VRVHIKLGKDYCFACGDEITDIYDSYFAWWGFCNLDCHVNWGKRA